MIILFNLSFNERIDSSKEFETFPFMLQSNIEIDTLLQV